MWHCVSSFFAIFAILRSREWPAPDYQNSLVFMNETIQNFSQVPLLIFLSLSLSLSKRPMVSPNVLIIGWWCSNTGAYSRRALGSAPKVTCATLSSQRISMSPYLSISYPPPYVRSPSPAAVRIPSTYNPSCSHNRLVTLDPASAPPPDTGT